ncbi:hypothetical protein [Salinimicrobium sediminilitoris]|uniref:hypothetical protein n=1 Tax=Salinimicrobium sediminilitoris TaxID=2876715 RepID=UPI001E5737AA|nr:hypothetical protein [Salinimicrobium sediminilitoris]MCC8360626.1 hypothetical protein [Salinimicrobium sediminilitoris]
MDLIVFLETGGFRRRSSQFGSGFIIFAVVVVMVNKSSMKLINGMLLIPIMVKYYVGNSTFNLQAGPQASIIPEDTGKEVNSFGLDASIGAEFDITENFQHQARYSLEITNRIGEVEGMPEDVKSRVNSLIFGIGYQF